MCGVPVKLSGSELWNEVDELTILKEWFQCAGDSKRSKFVISPCGGLKGLFAICDAVGKENWELIGSDLEVSESKLISCVVMWIFETVWIGCGNSELLVLPVLAKFIGWVENSGVFE